MLIAAVALLAQLSVPAHSNQIEDSVALLFLQGEDGSMQMQCTATAYETDGETTKFLTAAHCVTITNDKGDYEVMDTPIFLSNDNLDVKSHVRATIVEVGKQNKGYDYALLKAKLVMPVIPMGDERQESPHVDVLTVGAPTGIGKAYDKGVLSMRFIDRPIYLDDGKINWAGSMLVRIQTEGGSSGSAIVSAATNTIIGVLVGHKASLTVAVPVSRVRNRDSEFVLYPAAKK